MKKIPSLFLMTEDHQITSEVNPECQWVINGEGIATSKLDGTACAVIKGNLYKRYDNSRAIGKDIRVQNTKPLDTWIYCECPSERGKFIYWIPVTPKDYYHQIAWAWAQGALSDGTYELIGPEVQGNPHKVIRNMLIKHGEIKINSNPRTFEDIRDFLEQSTYEGIVWHHKDGRMCKITKEKFGFKW